MAFSINEILFSSIISIFSISNNKLEVDKYFQINGLVFLFGSKTKSGFVLCAKWKSSTEISEIVNSGFSVYPNKLFISYIRMF